MTKVFRKLMAENKMLAIVLVVFVVLGAILLFMGRFMREPEEYIRDFFYGAAELTEITPATLQEVFHYEQAIERRLEEFFSLVEGAGSVRVMVSPLGSTETVFAIDVNETRAQSTEADSQGGTRETENHQRAEQTVIITNRQGADTPLVIREIEPRIEGIVIIAEGGDNPLVRDALTRAARAVLGLEAHMVQVLTMK
ncbi:MAG: hypothetical protein FWB80_02460 [Defluviitaleaceae bacterium]|nr:hypothetical protein [Defluviitaleaceae bacterium]